MKALKILLAIALVLLPGALIYKYYEKPHNLMLPKGPAGGMYVRINHSLSNALQRDLSVKISPSDFTSEGSAENLRLLSEGRIDLGLYQSGSVTGFDNSGPKEVEFIANLYSEVIHLIAHVDSGLRSAQDLRNKRHKISIGMRDSGHFQAGLIVLAHLGIQTNEITLIELNLEQIVEGFRSGELDAAILALGTQADVLRVMFRSGKVRLLDIPATEALAANHLHYWDYTIPEGMYQISPVIFPQRGIRTVAARAQLLTHSGVPNHLVTRITALIQDGRFAQENGLKQLFQRGTGFAREKPGFPYHRGALEYYEPELRPLLPSDFVESLEGMRSFTVSFLVAGYLIYRWLRRQRERKKEHKLDQYIRRLLAIEKQQISYDEKCGANELRALQELLDEITHLRQAALGEFTAHELQDDHAVDCFVEMCHALSNKLNAKISRQRMDQAFGRLVTAVESLKPAESKGSAKS